MAGKTVNDDHWFTRMVDVREEIQEALDFQRKHMFKAISKFVDTEIRERIDKERDNMAEAVGKQIDLLDTRIRTLEKERNKQGGDLDGRHDREGNKKGD